MIKKAFYGGFFGKNFREDEKALAPSHLCLHPTGTYIPGIPPSPWVGMAFALRKFCAKSQ